MALLLHAQILDGDVEVRWTPHLGDTFPVIVGGVLGAAAGLRLERNDADAVTHELSTNVLANTFAKMEGIKSGLSR